jgi:hypothetical protein
MNKKKRRKLKELKKLRVNLQTSIRNHHNDIWKPPKDIKSLSSELEHLELSHKFNNNLPLSPSKLKHLTVGI